MSDMRGRHGRNFQGCYMQVEGDDEKINTYLDKLAFVPGCMVQGRRDLPDDRGVLFIQVMQTQLGHLTKMAVDCGLSPVV